MSKNQQQQKKKKKRKKISFERLEEFQWNFSGKMWLTIISEVTKNRVSLETLEDPFHLSLEDTFF